MLFVLPDVISQSPRFRHISVDDGLLQNSVNVITQDKKGFMWLATSKGLNRYDGHSILSFRHDPNNVNSIPADDIYSLYADDNNGLWIGTRWSGICRYDTKTKKFQRFKTNPNGNGDFNADGAFSIVGGPDGKIYFGTTNGGVNIYDPKSKKFNYIVHDSTNANSIPDNMVRKLCFDRKGKLWMAHPKQGVTCYDLKTKKILYRFTAYEKDENRHLNNNVVRSIYCDSKDRVWISTWSGGFNVFDQPTKTMYTNNTTLVDEYFLQFKENEIKRGRKVGRKAYTSFLYEKLDRLRMVYGFNEDKDGNIWISNIEAGLACFNVETGLFRQFMNNPNNYSSISDNNLLCNYIDRSGQIWCGTLSSGISILNPFTEQFGYYKTDPVQPGSIPNSQIWSLHYGKFSKKIFVGTKGTVYYFDPKNNSFTDYIVNKKGESLMHDQSLCEAVMEDHEGKVWVAVNGSGIYVYDTLTKTVINYHTDMARGGLINHTVSWLYEDSKQNIWVGFINGGIDKLDRKTNTFIHNYYNGSNDKKYLSSYFVAHINEDRNGKLWIATDTGINVLQNEPYKLEVFKHIPGDKKSLPSNRINSIFVDKYKKIWIGTSEGLSTYDEKSKSFINLTQVHQLPRLGVSGITEDLNGFLWLITDKGIARYNKSYHTWKSYDYTDGIQSNDFPSNAIINTPEGYILFGGSKGLNYFLPSKLKSNTTVPEVTLTNILLRNNPLKTGTDIAFTKELTLDYDHFFFTIEFAALDYTNSNKNQYRYKLEGFKDKWIDLGNVNHVSFVNLAPGEYTFILSASNNDGIWNENAVRLKITITPPFWQTMWFYSLCILFLVLVVYFYIKRRERKLRKEKLVLEHKVDTRTKELRHEKEKVEEAHKEIKDSINYAHKIQTALMPHEADFKRYFPESFVMFQPKDVVSGDFYWITRANDGTVIYATADCTGHGVPGGFMSMLGTTLLNEIVNERNIHSPEKILNAVREKVIAALKQTGAEGESKDGMDMTICVIDKTKNQLKFAGANNPVWIIHKDKTVTELKGDKQPVGFYLHQKEFTLHELNLKPGDTIISFTDGYADQFGGPKGKKFKYSNFEKKLIDVSGFTMEKQKELLTKFFDEWKSGYEQTDDVCVIGVRYE